MKQARFDPNYPHLGGDSPKWEDPDAGIFHPAALLMPAMSEAERKALGNSIHLHGLREPLVFCRGLLLDGRNRYDYLAGIGKTVAQIRGMKTVDGRPAVADVNLDDGDAVRFVLDMNLNRRHLTGEQKAEVNEKLTLIYGKREQDQGRPSGSATNVALTQTERAEKLGVDRRTIQRWDKEDAAEKAAAEAEGREPRLRSDEERKKEEAAAKKAKASKAKAAKAKATKATPAPAPLPPAEPEPAPTPAPSDDATERRRRSTPKPVGLTPARVYDALLGLVSGPGDVVALSHGVRNFLQEKFPDYKAVVTIRLEDDI